MAIQDIIKKILDDAAKQVQVIEAESADVMAKLENQQQQDQAEAVAQVKTKGAQARESLAQKTASLARQENAKKIAAAKTEAIEAALTALVDHLKGLSGKDMEAFYTKLASALLTGKGTVKTIKPAVEVVEKAVGKDITVETDDSVEGGLTYQGETLAVDMSFDALVLKEYRSELEIYFADQLKLG